MLGSFPDLLARVDLLWEKEPCIPFVLSISKELCVLNFFWDHELRFAACVIYIHTDLELCIGHGETEMHGGSAGRTTGDRVEAGGQPYLHDGSCGSCLLRISTALSVHGH